MRRTLLVLAMCLPLVGAKCMRHPEDIPPWGTPVRVLVQNDYGSEVEVYVVAAGTTQRLGLVHPNMSGRFEIPNGLIGTGSVELVARTSGGGRATSGPMNLQPGHTVEFIVTAQLYNSTATIMR